MSKIKVDARLTSKEDNLRIIAVGDKTENRISYKEEEVRVTILTFPNKIEMERVTKEYKVKFIFSFDENDLSTYKLVGHDEFLLDVKTKTLEITDNYIKIEYTLEDNEFSYILSLEDL